MAHVLTALRLLCFALIPSLALHAAQTDSGLPNPTSATAADGSLWFADNAARRIVRVTPDGRTSAFGVADSVGGLAAGADGSLWFTQYATGKIGRIAPNGALTEYPIPSAPSGPTSIVAGADGNIWFTEQLGNRIGRITPSGSMQAFDIPSRNSRPGGITAGLDGALWFIEEATGRIGRITLAGKVSEFATPATPAKARAASGTACQAGDIPLDPVANPQLQWQAPPTISPAAPRARETVMFSAVLPSPDADPRCINGTLTVVGTLDGVTLSDLGSIPITNLRTPITVEVPIVFPSAGQFTLNGRLDIPNATDPARVSVEIFQTIDQDVGAAIAGGGGGGGCSLARARGSDASLALLLALSLAGASVRALRRRAQRQFPSQPRQRSH